MIFEVNIPAHERPDLLARAIQSIQAQTYPHWLATVFDDSRSCVNSDLIASIRDARISYKRNPERLGAAANIDQCFSPDPRFGGRYGCLLEDDNYWLPEFLSSLVPLLKDQSWMALLVNQRIHVEGVGLKPKAETTRGDWFRRGPISPVDLRARLLLMEGLSNGGLVWKLGAGIDFRVGSSVAETGLHEACRSLLVNFPILFVDEPLAVWTSMSKDNTARASESDRLISRGMQSIRKAVLRSHGMKAVSEADRVAGQLSLQSELTRNLAYCGYWWMALRRSKGRIFDSVKATLKGLLIRLVQADPCSHFNAAEFSPSKPEIL